MKNKLKVLIAEDTRIARDILIMNLENFAKDDLDNIEYFNIEKAESFEKAHRMIVNTKSTGDYYDIIFADIDFTEDNKGGERDSGYVLIEKAFEICPLTKITTYSGQFRAAELWGKYEELKDKGLIVRTFDKSHNESGESNWMAEGLNKIIKEINGGYFIWDIWNNHELIIDEIKSQTFSGDPFTNLIIKNTIISNLESALLLFMNIDRLQGKEIIYRMMIYLYHNSLEILCRADKTDEQIIKESDENKTLAEQFIMGTKGKEVILNFPDSVNSQRIFISSINDERIKFVDTLNYYRNKSIHPAETFKLDISNVLFSVLAFTLAVTSNKNQIAFDYIKSFVNESKNLGAKNALEELLSFIDS